MSETKLSPDVQKEQTNQQELFFKWEPTDSITITGVEFATLNSFVEAFARPMTLLKDSIMNRMKDNNQLKLVDKDGNIVSSDTKEVQKELPLEELSKQVEDVPTIEKDFNLTNQIIDTHTDGSL